MFFSQPKTNINPFPNKPWFLQFKCLLYKSFENTIGKREIAHNFSFSHFFLPSTIFIKFEIVVCKLFQSMKSFNFIWSKIL